MNENRDPSSAQLAAESERMKERVRKRRTERRNGTNRDSFVPLWEECDLASPLHCSPLLCVCASSCIYMCLCWPLYVHASACIFTCSILMCVTSFVCAILACLLMITATVSLLYIAALHLLWVKRGKKDCQCSGYRTSFDALHCMNLEGGASFTFEFPDESQYLNND